MAGSPHPPSETDSEPESIPDGTKEAKGAAVEDIGEPVPMGLSIDDMVGQVAWSDHEISLARWKQGHLVRGIPIVWLSPVGVDLMTGLEQRLAVEAPQWPEGTFDAVVCSQTCDIGAGPPGNWHPFVIVAPLIHESALESKGRAKLAGTGRLDYAVGTMPPDHVDREAMLAAHAEAAARRAERKGVRAVPEEFRGVADIPNGYRWFADLRILVPISKALLLTREPIEGFTSEKESLAFAETLAQKFRRPALHEALSEALPEALEELVRNVGANKQCIAKVEQVRLNILSGDRLNPSRGGLLVIASDVALTPAEQEVWEGFNEKLAQVFAGSDIAYTPIVHYDAPTMLAATYRQTVPVRCRHIGHTRWP